MSDDLWGFQDENEETGKKKIKFKINKGFYLMVGGFTGSVLLIILILVTGS